MNSGKQLALRGLLETWQKEAVKRAHTQTFEIDMTPYWKVIEPLFENLTRPETIIQFGKCAKVYHIDDVKKELAENQREAGFLSLIGSKMQNEAGQSVQKLPPLRDALESGDAESIKKHMVRHVAECRRFGGTIPTQIAHQILLKEGAIAEDDLDFLVYIMRWFQITDRRSYAKDFVWA